MPTNPMPRYYWDSCVFLSYIEGTEGRVADIEALLDAAENGKCEIYTSVASIAEVVFAKSEKDNRALDPDVEAEIQELWQQPQVIKVVEFYRPIADEARRLARQSMIEQLGLKPMDAIHIATADRLTVDALHTYDRKMQNNETLVTFPIVAPKAEQLPLLLGSGGSSETPAEDAHEGSNTEAG